MWQLWVCCANVGLLRERVVHQPGDRRPARHGRDARMGGIQHAVLGEDRRVRRAGEAVGAVGVLGLQVEQGQHVLDGHGVGHRFSFGIVVTGARG
jgi:hypothetical protein